MLDHVPLEILSTILGKLDAKSLLTAAATCRTVRDAAEKVSSIRPHMTPENKEGLIRWMAVRDHATKVTVLRVSRALSPPPLQTVEWVASLLNIKSFIAAFCRIPMSIFSTLPSTAPLLNIHLHQLSPGLSDVFSTRILSKFPHLKKIHISFAPGWTVAIVGPGMETLSALESFEVRRIPAIAVTKPIPARQLVALHAFDVLSSQIPVAPYATTLRLECDDAPIDTLEEMLGNSRRLTSLTIASTGMLLIPHLYDMNHLEHLNIWTTIYRFPELHRLTHLQKLYINADSCVVFDQTSSLPPSIVSVQATAQGTPIDLYDYLS